MELTKLQQKLLNSINEFGLVTTSNMIGGYEYVLKVLKGVEFLTRDVMLKTIKEICEEYGSIPLYDLGLDSIVLYNDNGKIEQIENIGSTKCIVVAYGGYNYDTELGEYMIKTSDIDTNHLYEIVDGMMDYHENQ